MSEPRNVDEATVVGFGDEWTAFDQTGLEEAELDALLQRDLWLGTMMGERILHPQARVLRLPSRLAAEPRVRLRGLMAALTRHGGRGGTRRVGPR